MAKGVQTIVTQAAGLSQSGLMGAALIAGFLIYLAAKGKLGSYWSILMGGTTGATSTSTGATIVPGTQTPGTPGVAVNPFAGLPNPFGGTFWHDFVFGPAAPVPATPATPPATPSTGGQ
jgi:hypothetical protein